MIRKEGKNNISNCGVGFVDGHDHGTSAPPSLFFFFLWGLSYAPMAHKTSLRSVECRMPCSGPTLHCTAENCGYIGITYMKVHRYVSVSTTLVTDEQSG